MSKENNIEQDALAEKKQKELEEQRAAYQQQSQQEWIEIEHVENRDFTNTKNYLTTLSGQNTTVKRTNEADYDEEMQGDKKLQFDVNVISQALEADSAKQNRRLHLAPKTRERLKVNRGRMTSQLLLNSSRKIAWWDSDEMTAVKDKVKELEDFLAGQHNRASLENINENLEITDEDLQIVEDKYEKAIIACKKYLDVKSTKTGSGRYTLVRDKMISLMDELSEFSTMRIRMRTDKDLSWTKVPTYRDLLVSYNLQKFVDKCVGEKQVSEDFEQKGREVIQVNHNIDKNTLDPGARVMLELLTNDQSLTSIVDHGENPVDKTRIARYLLNLLTDMQSDTKVVYFHSGFAGYKGKDNARKYKDNENKTKICNTFFALMHDANGNLSMAINGGNTVKLSGINVVMENIRGRLIKAEQELNGLHATDRKVTANIGTWNTNDIMRPLANDSYVKKPAPVNFLENVKAVIQNRYQGIDQSRLSSLKDEKLRSVLKHVLDNPNLPQDDLEEFLATMNGEIHWSKVKYDDKDTILEGPDDVEGNEELLDRVKKNAIKYLSTVTFMAENMFDNKTPQQLHKMAMSLVTRKTTPDALKKQIRAERGGKYYVERNDDAGKYINSTDARLAMEKWSKRDKTKTTVEFKEQDVVEEEVKAEELIWSNDEIQIKNFVSDLIFAKDIWTLDKEVETGNKGLVFKQFVQKKENIDVLASMLKDETLLKSVLERIPFINNAADNSEKIINVFKNWLQLDKNNVDLSKSREEISAQITKITSDRNAELPEGDNNSILDEKAEIELDKFLDGFAESQISSIQKIIDEQLKDNFGSKEAELQMPASSREKGIGAEERASRLKKEKEWLVNSLRKNVTTGDEGQAKFLKQVLGHYFENISAMDQRSVVAYMLREAKPSNKPGEDKNAKNNENALKTSKESCLAGMFKGAGPLLQKTLQGIPSEGVPALLKYAMEDTRSRLLPIPREYVLAQLNELIQNSEGKISKIEIEKSLGAASVGQAFLVKVYGPSMPEGTNHVVKVLRPDAYNRMEREKAIFEKCAEDCGPAMEVTFQNTYKRIKEELNLEIEAAHVVMGKENYDTTQVGSEKDDGVHSMNLSNLTKTTPNVMLIEIAKGKTVDKDISEIEEQIYDTLHNVYEFTDTKKLITTGNDDGSYGGPMFYRGVIEKITPLLAKVQKKQKYLAELAKKWVTQSLYSSDGFYHGDLHAGNIILDEEGATLIDYGNATTLSASQQTNMLLLFASAGAGFYASDLFVKGFEALLTGDKTDKQFTDRFDEQKNEFLQKVQTILNMGDEQDAAQRVAILASEAQKMGFPLPAAVANFIQSQMRLQNTMDSYNKLITDMQGALSIAQESLLHESSPMNHFSLKQTVNSFLAYSNDEFDAKVRKKLLHRTFVKWYARQIGKNGKPILNNMLDATSPEEQAEFDSIFLDEEMERFKEKLNALRKAQADNEEEDKINALKVEMKDEFYAEFDANSTPGTFAMYNEAWYNLAQNPFKVFTDNYYFAVITIWDNKDPETGLKYSEVAAQTVKEHNDQKLTDAYLKLKEQMEALVKDRMNPLVQDAAMNSYMDFAMELIRLEIGDVKNAKAQQKIKVEEFNDEKPTTFVDASGQAISNNKPQTFAKLLFDAPRIIAAAKKDADRFNQ